MMDYHKILKPIVNPKVLISNAMRESKKDLKKSD